MRRLYLLLLGFLLAPPVLAVRLVTLAPHLTELAFEAGAGEQLVAVSSWSDYPQQARDLPRIADAFRVDYEQLLQLQPDWVLLWQEGTPRQVELKLRRLGLQVWPVSIRALQDIPTTLRRLGRLAGTEAVAEQAAARFERRLAEMGPVRHGTPVPVFIQISQRPLMTVNGQHLLSEVVRFCGGRNVFDDLQVLVPQVGLESVLARKPAWIIQSEREPAELWHGLQSKGLLSEKLRVLVLPPEQIMRPTSRLLDGVERICQALSG